MASFFTVVPVALYHYGQWVCPTTQTVSSKKTRGYLLFIKSPTSTWLIVHNWDPIKFTEWINEKMDGWLNCKLSLTSIKAINQYPVTSKAIAATQGPTWKLKIPKIAWPALGVSHQDKRGWDWGGETSQSKTMFLFLFLYSKAPIPQASTDKKKIIQHAIFVFKHILDELKYWYFPDVFSLYFEQWFLFLVDKILVTQHGKRQKDKFFLHTYPFEVWRNSLHFKKKKKEETKKNIQWRKRFFWRRSWKEIKQKLRYLSEFAKAYP